LSVLFAGDAASQRIADKIGLLLAVTGVARHSRSRLVTAVETARVSQNPVMAILM
jgi:hypothetical protein